MEPCSCPIRIQPAGRFVEFRKSEIEQSIPARFQQQVKLHGDRIAVSTPAEQISYGELNARANRIAGWIAGRTCERQEPVAILFEQGIDLIVAILGVLKAGRIYVPLHPRYQHLRLSAIVKHSGAGLILTGRQLLPMSGELMERSHVADVESISAGIPPSEPDTLPEAEDPAYIYYTSGSTGAPKGVVDCHRNVLHNIMRYTNCLRICADDRLTLLQAAPFSGAVSSMFGALLNGATLFPFDPHWEPPGELPRWALRNRITMWHSVPALFRQLVAGGDSFPDMRVIRLEGDLASPADVALYRKHFPSSCTLSIGLGTTETGLIRQFLIQHETELQGSVVPVGYAVEDMDVSVVDEAGVPVADCEVGEMVVTSRYVAVGYWRDEAQTADRFRASADDPQVRTYLTGDMGRMRADGRLDFIGRKAFDVKIAGQRVEIAEVEAALVELPGVESSAVASVERASGEKRLVAYLVARGDLNVDPGSLRRQLATRLPEHSIPAAFIRLDALPLNENGKIDRSRLPAPGHARPPLSTPFAAPETAAERRLAEIWCKELGLDEVGIDDDFFALGGASLDMIRILYQSHLEASAFLDEPTIRQLARRTRFAD